MYGYLGMFTNNQITLFPHFSLPLCLTQGMRDFPTQDFVFTVLQGSHWWYSSFHEPALLEFVMTVNILRCLRHFETALNNSRMNSRCEVPDVRSQVSNWDARRSRGAKRSTLSAEGTSKKQLVTPMWIYQSLLLTFTPTTISKSLFLPRID